MRLFANLLKQYPKRDEWAAISLRIASGFENARQEWFDICVMQVSGLNSRSDTSKTELNTALSGHIVLVLKAYQLGSISGFLESQKYFRKSNGKDFCDLLWAQVCGTDSAAVAGILREFFNTVPDARDFYLAGRVAEHLTRQEVALYEAMLLTPMVRAFWLFNCISVAFALSDRVTEATLYKLLDLWVEELPGKLNQLAQAMHKAAAAA